MTIELITTDGLFELDGGSWEVTNNIWLVGDDREVIVFDAAHDHQPIVDAVGGRRVRAIVLTHGHNDHINAAVPLRDAVDAPIRVHPADRMLWDVVWPGDAPDETIEHGAVYAVAGHELTVLHTPGHSPGCCCFHDVGSGVVFTGDTLFCGGPGATGRSFSDEPTIIESILTRLLVLPDETVVHTGHGESTTIGAERERVVERAAGAGPLRAITGVVQHYAWGDLEFIPRLLGRHPDGQPWAELWLGTHGNGPSRLADGRPLSEVSGVLPYLLKVLAAAEPLSLQTHPDAEQARSGYQHGRYVDPYAKPELLCALTPFEAFCGVRPLDETVALLVELGLDRFAEAFAASGVAGTIRALFAGRVPIEPIVEACAREGSDGRTEARWVVELAERYPGDPSVVVTLLLNHVQLEPGEALQLGPGNLHSYLSGAGIELMGASDNVVRAGLTAKPVDVDLLLDVMDVRPLLDPVVSAGTRYPLPDTSISLLRLPGPARRVATGHELVVTSSGRTGYLAPHDVLDVALGETGYVAVTA